MSEHLPTPTSYAEVEAAIRELPVALRTVRRIRNLTLRDVAVETGIGHSTIQRIEAGEECRTDTLILLLRWLDKQWKVDESG